MWLLQRATSQCVVFERLVAERPTNEMPKSEREALQFVNDAWCPLQGVRTARSLASAAYLSSGQFVVVVVDEIFDLAKLRELFELGQVAGRIRPLPLVPGLRRVVAREVVDVLGAQQREHLEFAELLLNVRGR